MLRLSKKADYALMAMKHLARKMGEPQKRAWLLDESSQLRAIFSKACTTARIREHRAR